MLEGEESDDINVILGVADGSSDKVLNVKSAAEQVKITNHEEQISNSSSPLENEKLQRQASE